MLIYIVYFQVLVQHTPADQFQSLVYHLLDGLIDPHGESSSGACVVLNQLLKVRAAQLHSQVSICIYLVIST